LGLGDFVFTMPRGYRDLKVWRDGKQLAVEVCQLCRHPPLSTDWGLRDQLCRSAVSIPSNIAEGEARGGDRESVRFFSISAGSLAELRTQLEIAFELGLLSPETQKDLDARLDRLAAGIGSLIRSRSATFRPAT
jgi:four helix bundle protein